MLLPAILSSTSQIINALKTYGTQVSMQRSKKTLQHQIFGALCVSFSLDRYGIQHLHDGVLFLLSQDDISRREIFEGTRRVSGNQSSQREQPIKHHCQCKQSVEHSR